MKKGLKLNRGFLLSAVVLIGVIVYISIASGFEAKNTSQIRDRIEEYLPVQVRYSMLPEEYRDTDATVPAEDLEKYISKMKNEISSYFDGNGENEKYVLDTLEASLREQAKNPESRLSEYDKTVTDMTVKFTDDNTASVTVETRITYKYSSDVSSFYTSDTLSYAKVGGIWKLTYAYIAGPSFFVNEYNYDYYDYAYDGKYVSEVE